MIFFLLRLFYSLLLLGVVLVDQVAGFGRVAHVDPCTAILAVLEEQLVDMYILFEDTKQAAAILLVLDVEVGGKAHDVLTVLHTTHDTVQLTGAVATRDIDRVAKGDTCGFEDMATEVAEVLNLFLFWQIVHLQQFGTHGADQLEERKVVGQKTMDVG